MKKVRQKYVNRLGAHKCSICTARNKPWREGKHVLGQFRKKHEMHKTNSFNISERTGIFVCIKLEMRFTQTNKH